MGTVFASGAVLGPNGEVLPVAQVGVPGTMPSGASEAPAPEPGTEPEEPDEGADLPDEDPPSPDEPDEPEDEGDEGEPVAEGREDRPSRRERRKTYVQGVVEENRWLRSQLEQRGQGQQAPEPPVTQEPQPDPTEPQEQWYGTTTEYHKAWTLWALNKQQQALQEQAAVADAKARWAVREQEGLKKYQDYNDVQARVTIAPQIAPYFAEAVRKLSTGADIMYYLGSHAQDLAALNQMPPAEALVWLGELHGRLQGRTQRPSNGQAPPRRTGPPTHQPMQPVTPGAAQPVTGFRSGMSLTEYDAQRREQRKALGLRP